MPEDRIVLTDTRIVNLPKPAIGRLTVYDAKTPGLGVRVSHTGHRSFFLFRKVNGRPVRITLGMAGAINVKKARELAGKYNSQIAEGTNPAEAKRAKRLEATLADLWSEFLAKHAKPYARTWEVQERHYERFLKRWANRPLAEISTMDVQALHAKIGKDCGHYMANRILQLLRSMFNRGIAWGMSTGNPCQRVKLYKEVKRRRFLQPQELAAFFKALALEPNGGARDAILTMLLTGARSSNVLGMRWADIDWERRVWTIPAAQSKNAEPVEVFLAPAMVELLENRQTSVEGPWVFPARSKTGHMEGAKKAWARVLINAGLNDLRLHDLRRSVGAYQASAGASLTIIGRSLGHKSIQAAAIYAQLLTDPVRASLEGAVNTMLTHGGVNKPAEVVQLPTNKTKRRFRKS